MREDLHTTLGERLRELFRNYIGYLAVALVSLAYIATSFLTLGATGKGIGEIVADGAVVCDIDQIKENTEKQLFGIMMDISKEKLS